MMLPFSLTETSTLGRNSPTIVATVWLGIWMGINPVGSVCVALRIAEGILSNLIRVYIHVVIKDKISTLSVEHLEL